tara:strand:- start:233 stop:388 length:156 start_codon:yes stop_codon:yes gene_type:complete
MNYLEQITRQLHPKYNFDAKESLASLACRMEDKDWELLKGAIRNPKGVVNE